VRTHLRHPVVDKLNRYVDKLFEMTADRLAPKVAERIAPRLEAQIAALEVLTDADALDDLRIGSAEDDEDLIDYDEIRREVGLA
jgi:hypothetical protein